MSSTVFAQLAVAGLLAGLSLRAQTPTAPASTPAVPLAGMTAAETALWNAGEADFTVAETPQTGLGPLFNDVSCQACHAGPTVGGRSARTVTRFGRLAGATFDPLLAEDGSLLHSRSIAPALRESVPADANVTALRITIALLGDGLIDAIPDGQIIANASAAKPYGIHGTVAYVTDLVSGETRVGRFGWKAQHATLLDFNADALNNEIGLTNRLFPRAAAPDGNEALLSRFVSPEAPLEDQPAADGLAELDLLTAFTRFLAPPVPKAPTPATLAGAKLFASVGCAVCHTPSYSTGPNASAALANKTVALYSDLLLHDMGSLGDGIAQGAASTTQMRTAPLWGLGGRKALLHDGRATSVEAAILAHDGEGAQVSARYAALTATEQAQLLAFLSSL